MPDQIITVTFLFDKEKEFRKPFADHWPSKVVITGTRGQIKTVVEDADWSGEHIEVEPRDWEKG